MNTYFPIRIVFFILFLLIAGTPAPGFSFNNDFTDTGGYVVLGGLYGFEDFQDTENASVDDSWGFEFRGGYRFNDYLAAEGELDLLDGFDMKVPMPPFGTGRFTVDGGLVTANAKAYLPLGRFQPYAILGAGVMWTDLRTTYPVGYSCGPWWCYSTYARLDNSASFVLKYGVGMDIHINDNWAITLDATYVQPFASLEDLNYVSFAWGFRYMY
jgi:opacity protein-like surface antigen